MSLIDNIEQTRFLGASISAVSCSVGWNEQSSSVQVTLVEDLRGGDEFTKPDPGTPVSLVLDTFRFDGIVQSWEYHQSTTGRYYDVNLTDPRELLNGCQLILGGYNGSTGGVPNLFNLYGYLESTLFGNALTNEAGMPLSKLLAAAQDLLYGTETIYGGPYVVFNGHYFAVDFSGLPETPDYYRITGDYTTVAELVSQVCGDAGHDYIVRMTYQPNADAHLISFKTVSRATQPDLTLVKNYIDDVDELSSRSHGRELRNDVCSVFVVGGEIESIFTSSQNGQLAEAANIWPYWGLDANGNAIIGTGINNDHTVTVDSRKMSQYGLGDTYTFTVGELRAALASYDAWSQYVAMMFPSKASSLGIVGIMDIDKLSTLLTRGHTNLAPVDYQRDKKDLSNFQKTPTLVQKLQAIYEFVRNYANEFYGKKYMVRVPFVSSKLESDTFRLVTSYEPTDSGYLSEADWVSGNNPLNLPQEYNPIFQTPEGKFECFVRFDSPSQYDISHLNPDEAAYGASIPALFVKANVEQNFVYLDADSQYSPRAVITLSGPVNIKAATTATPAYQALLYEMFYKLTTDEAGSKEKVETLVKNAAGGLPIGPMAPASYLPSYVAVPLKSNTLTYGPWYAAGAEGKVRFEKNSGLVPWNFGGYTYMNYAGFAQVDSAITLQQIAEMGSFEEPGVPSIQLGDELISGGPNVTGLDISVSEAGLKTNYRLRTYTPTFGQFSKQNADRFQRLARSANNIRSNLLKKTVGSLARMSQAADRLVWKNGASPWNAKTPHQTLVAKITSYKDKDSNTVKRALLSTATINEGLAALTDADDTEYQKEAMCGLECLLMPYSVDPTSSSLPHFEEPASYKTSPSTDDDWLVNMNFHPFGLPDYWVGNAAFHTGFNSNPIATVVTSNSSYPSSGIRTDIAEFDKNSARAVGLAGPIMITGWGYDIFGNPAPNAVEYNTSAVLPTGTTIGNFVTNFRERPDLWKTGPLNIRWNPITKMWDSATSLHIGKFNQDGNIVIYSNPSTATKIVVHPEQWLETAPLPPGTRVVFGMINGNPILIGGRCG